MQVVVHELTRGLCAVEREQDLEQDGTVVLERQLVVVGQAGVDVFHDEVHALPVLLLVTR